jgi:hypothetical protein
VSEPLLERAGTAATPRRAATSLRRWLGAVVAGVLVSFAVSRVWIDVFPELAAANLPVGLAVGCVGTGLIARVSSVGGWIVAVLLTIGGLTVLIASLVFVFIAAAG